MTTTLAPPSLTAGRHRAVGIVADRLWRRDPYEDWKQTGEQERRRVASRLLFVRWRVNRVGGLRWRKELRAQP